MSQHTLVDAEHLRVEVRENYRAVAAEPAGAYHFQFADIASRRRVPAEALRDIDLWTG